MGNNREKITHIFLISGREKRLTEVRVCYGKLSIARSRDYLLCQPENWRSFRILSGFPRISDARIPISEIFIHIGADCREIYTQHINQM